MPTRRPRFLARSLVFLAAIIVLAGAAPAARALPVAGQLSLVGSLALGAASAEFLPLPAGNALTVVPSTGSFAALVGTAGTLAPLDLSPAQVGTALAVANVFSLFIAPTMSFELTRIHPGAFDSAPCALAPAAGQTCTPASSPALQLFNGPTAFGLGSTLSFAFTGRIQEGADLSDFTALVTAQFPMPYQNLLAALAAGDTVEASFSATLHAQPVPEPSTLAACALGLCALASARRRGAR